VKDKVLQRGSHFLGLNLDLCDETAIEKGIAAAVSSFGRIDVLINNMASFCFSDTLSITTQQLDTLIATNLRATFLMSKKCIPYLEKSNNPHIINISPPLHLDPKWFSHHVAFTLSKYAMSMCTLGMAEEFKPKRIAINSLWPETTIATITIEDNFTDPVYKHSRLPTIMADAAYILAEKNATICTGNFFIDEDLLRETGIDDFSCYAIDSDNPLVQDLFTSEDALTIKENRIPLTPDMYLK
jgi:citronellol/citronellal dehydrogenase